MASSTRNLVKKAAETLSQFCTDKCMLFHAMRIVLYFTDYKHKNELIEFSSNFRDPGVFILDGKNGGGIGILEIHQITRWN